MKKIIHFVIIIFIVGIVSCSDAFNDDAIHSPFIDNDDINHILSGLPDTNFGTGGASFTDFNAGDDAGYDIALQPDGKVIAVGCSINNQNRYYRIAIARFTQNGSIDKSFGNRGIIIEDFNNTKGSRAFSVALQNDGKIVVAGRIETYTEILPGSNMLLTNTSNIIILRYNPDGSRDTSFGNNGIVINNTYNLEKPFEMANKVVIQPDDNKIIVAGSSENNDDKHRFVVIRFNTNGTIDSTFGNNGYVIVDPDNADNVTIAHDIALQNDGKIVVSGCVGTKTFEGYTPESSLVVRLNEIGQLDNNFGISGKIINQSIKEAYCVAIQSDNKILLSGIPKSADFAIARYNENGTLDSDFGTNGLSEFSFAHKSGCYTNNIHLLTDGSIIISGGYDQGLVLIKITSQGNLESSFGSYGSVFNNFHLDSPRLSSSTINSNDLITIVGYYGSGGYRDFLLTRFWL